MTTCFVKLSGDLVRKNTAFFSWLKELVKDNKVVICTGGGTDINQVFAEKGLPVQFGPLGRETNTEEEKELAAQVLENNKKKLEDLLAEQGIGATVILPILSLGGVLCHVNGDQMVLAAYLGFDELYVATTPERVEKKKEQFEKYPKIKIIGF